MKVNNFISDWNRTHTSSPSFQNAIEWARKTTIEKACKWLEEKARDYACATIRCPYGEEEEIICDVHREIVEDFRKAMEE